jgi:osmoprotectant transport system permease protein
MSKFGVNVVSAAASILGLSSLFIDWFKLKANRLVTGHGLGFFDSLGTPLGLFLVAVWLATLAVSVLNPRWSNRILPLFFIGSLTGVVIGSGVAARTLLAGAGDVARVGLSGGFWISFFAVYLLYFVVTRKGQPFSLILSVLGPVVIIAALLFGWLDAFSVLAEYQSQKARFAAEFWRHLEIFGLSIAIAAVIGLPLGVWASRSRAVRPLLGILGIIQTVPSLALFGLLLITLVAVENALPSIGISAIGALPAVIAITLYSLLPVVQNTYTGIRSVNKEACDAGEGLGMSRLQILSKIELPLAAPSILSGVKIAAVQAIGGTAVAALIGAGGLGFFIFQGLGQAAPDLILLGAISVVILALLVNGVFQFVEDRLKPRGVALA